MLNREQGRTKEEVGSGKKNTSNKESFVGRGKQKDRPATQAVFSSRENSSNGGKFRQNFMAESYECKKGCVNKFL
jgi:hypothetical protein